MLRAFDDAYYPNIIMRPSEMRAIAELPESEKDSIFPIIRICPWMSSKLFQNSIDKIIEVYGERPFICDVDETHPSRADRDAITYFRSLFEGEDRSQNWINHITENSSYIPTLHHSHRSQQEIADQLSAFVELERGMAIRISPRDVGQINELRQLLENYVEAASVDTICVIVDLGLIQNLQTSTMQALAIIESIREIENLRIVLSAASFPSSFSRYQGLASIDIVSRQVFVEVRRRYNNVQLTYSDWASTKPRMGGGGTPVPRIDVPRNSSWLLARNQELEWDYSQASRAIVESEYWNDIPNVWGAQMIERTANGDSYGINSPAKATAARINIHLFTQRHFGSQAGNISTDEPWVDL